MLTYNLDKEKSSLYLQIYEYIKKDIENGKILAHEKLPSKRNLAEHHDISTITVQNAYLQLFSEGYIYSRERSGYFASEIPQLELSKNSEEIHIKKEYLEENEDDYYSIDISENSINKNNFPFNIWNKEMREVMSSKQEVLLAKIPSLGLWELRKAIADYLQKFRGLQVNPNYILIGAGTEYLYAVLVKLLGRENTIAVEKPCYKKIVSVYQSENIEIKHISLDERGLSIEKLYESEADIAHISPAHNFPTGIVMPISRRLEILEWAKEKENRYIIEDDYDSEFRFMTKPLPSLFSKDMNKTIYMNTFSKTLAPTLRISYMILPKQLIERYNKSMYFTTCPVCGFEQHILASFISKGYFERHINKMRKKYKIQRDEILKSIAESKLGKQCEIREELSGLHFILKVKTVKEDSEIKELAKKYGLKLSLLSDFELTAKNDCMKQHKSSSELLINYSGIDRDVIQKVVRILSKII